MSSTLSDAGARAVRRAAGELDALLGAYHATSRCHAALWTGDPTGPAHCRSSSRRRRPPPLDGLPRPAASQPPVAWRAPDGDALVVALAGIPGTWLVVGPCPGDGAELARHAGFLRTAVQEQLQAAVEAEHAAHELSERYEEINLLYAISEILGRAVTLEETAATILTELAETVGAGRAALLLHDRVTDTLQAVAAVGPRVSELLPIAADDAESASGRVFRTLHPTIVDAQTPVSAAEQPYRAGPMLSVPLVWSTPQGGEPLGVVHLSGRRAGPFTAGDLKLVTAIATQIAAAVQNARLVRASLQQQRMADEMALAHDLQMRLLPRVNVAAPHARVAARVAPAESVGGDFYNLFRLGEGRTGVMIGDVSSHGYRAALIMALAMSATAIHAQASSDPSETLGAVLRSLHEELESTEMYITTFYAVVDPARGELRYANAGHPHAFIVREDGTAERLGATTPPLGMVDEPPSTEARPWRAGRDLLVLFTDGISDAVDLTGRRLGEEPVLEAIRAERGDDPEAIVASVFRQLDAFQGGARPRDDLTLLVLRSEA
ncbi:GAF domain-containing SpoIIE family protein phosphatase [Roseisolibacter sp. H3M3-2]|uniref:PP2C family protein-serine/threonine phosphatase n=1 Tax=Roseisolibacter sp. H3M3-2 TaxID=3031323 RepID=UPI0023DA843F|nr:GAF domain-containing SpoIIE family protein phosphatase [Roseisolibacter sp. H3M3-2]MDF1502187.1 SpoIIE family protein phosphatase [Roseisolibacter sp. H3M3-2]